MPAATARNGSRGRDGAGAGLVHAVAPPDTVAALVQAEPDLQTLAHPFDQPPSKALLDLIEKADALIHWNRDTAEQIERQVFGATAPTCTFTTASA